VIFGRQCSGFLTQRRRDAEVFGGHGSGFWNHRGHRGTEVFLGGNVRFFGTAKAPRTPRGALIFMKFHVFHGSGLFNAETQRCGTGILPVFHGRDAHATRFLGRQSQVASRMSRVNLSCCGHAVARNRESKSAARFLFWSASDKRRAVRGSRHRFPARLR
jgi:hypothetical protein